MSIDHITSTPFSTVAELIDLYDELAESESAISPPRDSKWAFRGQPRDYGTLVPSFQREFPREAFGAAEIIERRLIDAFREHYEHLSDPSDEMPSYDRIATGYDLRCLSVMQHYEIPTRLLDWTASFWTSVYFACASAPDANAELWYYDRNIFNEQDADPELFSLIDTSPAPKFEPPLLSRRNDNLVVELDPRITPRMQEQRAHHTVSASIFSDHAPLLMELASSFDVSSNSPPSLRRIIIDSSCKSKAIRFLAEHLDITASTIFPDVVGLGRFLRWQFETLRTMLL